MNEEQLSALSDILDAARDKLHNLVWELGDPDERLVLTPGLVEDLQISAERISEEAFNLVELLAAAQEEDYD